MAPKRTYITCAEKRRDLLLADEWVAAVTPTSVVCKACHKAFQLDQHYEYFSSNWNRHRNLCRAIKALLKKEIPERTRPPRVNVGQSAAECTHNEASPTTTAAANAQVARSFGWGAPTSSQAPSMGVRGVTPQGVPFNGADYASTNDARPYILPGALLGPCMPGQSRLASSPPLSNVHMIPQSQNSLMGCGAINPPAGEHQEQNYKFKISSLLDGAPASPNAPGSVFTRKPILQVTSASYDRAFSYYRGLSQPVVSPYYALSGRGHYTPYSTLDVDRFQDGIYSLSASRYHFSPNRGPRLALDDRNHGV